MRPHSCNSAQTNRTSTTAPVAPFGGAWNFTVTWSLPRVSSSGSTYSASKVSVGWYAIDSVAIFYPSTRMSNDVRRPLLPRYVQTSFSGLSAPFSS